MDEFEFGVLTQYIGDQRGRRRTRANTSSPGIQRDSPRSIRRSLSSASMRQASSMSPPSAGSSDSMIAAARRARSASESLAARACRSISASDTCPAPFGSDELTAAPPRPLPAFIRRLLPWARATHAQGNSPPMVRPPHNPSPPDSRLATPSSARHPPLEKANSVRLVRRTGGVSEPNAVRYRVGLRSRRLPGLGSSNDSRACPHGSRGTASAR